MCCKREMLQKELEQNGYYPSMARSSLTSYRLLSGHPFATFLKKYSFDRGQ
jgi:hypothetical protein